MDNALDKIHHVCINVADVPAAVNWYTTSFNCEVLSQNTLEAEIAFENIKLHLVLPSKTPSHLAYEKTDAETLGELKPRFNDVQSTFISDSTGNPVEIVKRGSINK